MNENLTRKRPKKEILRAGERDYDAKYRLEVFKTARKQLLLKNPPVGFSNSKIYFKNKNNICLALILAAAN